MNAADGRPILALAGQWSHEFVHVMEAMADLRPEMEPDAGAAANDGPWLWWKQSLDAVPGAVAWVGTSEKTWLFLGQQILAAAGIESGSQDEIRSSYLEVLRQSLSAFASAIGSQLEREVTCTEGSEETPPASQTASCRLSIRARAEALPELAFAASPSLLDAMTKPAAEPAPAPPAAAAEAQEAADASARVFNTLDLLLDVEMPVSVSIPRNDLRGGGGHGRHRDGLRNHQRHRRMGRERHAGSGFDGSGGDGWGVGDRCRARHGCGRGLHDGRPGQHSLGFELRRFWRRRSRCRRGQRRARDRAPTRDLRRARPPGSPRRSRRPPRG